MAQSSKNAGRNRISIRIPPGQLNALSNALDRIERHYGPLLAVWRELTPDQCQQLLEHSPLLARLLNLWPGGEPWR